MRLYLPLLLIMGLLAVANVSSTDYLYAYGNVGDIRYLGAEDDEPEYVGKSGYLATGDDYEDVVVFKTYEFTRENVKFLVKNHTRCLVIGIEYYLWTALRIVIDEGSHKGETGWVDELMFFPDR